jgi:hypothetical protein
LPFSSFFSLSLFLGKKTKGKIEEKGKIKGGSSFFFFLVDLGPVYF